MVQFLNTSATAKRSMKCRVPLNAYLIFTETFIQQPAWTQVNEEARFLVYHITVLTNKVILLLTELVSYIISHFFVSILQCDIKIRYGPW